MIKQRKRALQFCYVFVESHWMVMAGTSLKVGRGKITFFSTWKVIPFSQVSSIWISSDRKLFYTLNVCKNGCRFEICPFNKPLQNSIFTKIILQEGSKSLNLDPCSVLCSFSYEKLKKKHTFQNFGTNCQFKIILYKKPTISLKDTLILLCAKQNEIRVVIMKKC